jgi:hypothetical protein
VSENQKASGFIYDKDYQPTECPAKYHYCYCTGESYQLAYKIPNPDPSKPPIGEVADLGSYVNTVYKYLLGISGLVAIVMIMIGGVQYVTSVGGGSISAAKERIQHAVIGLILLFCAALILQTVNPRLLTLQPPRLPSVKRIEIVTGDTNCKVLQTRDIKLKGIQREKRKNPVEPKRSCKRIKPAQRYQRARFVHLRDVRIRKAASLAVTKHSVLRARRPFRRMRPDLFLPQPFASNWGRI